MNELNTVESVPTWCTIDTRIGALTVHLDEGRCFDAEVYCDEVEEIPHPERPDDQRGECRPRLFSLSQSLLKFRY